MAEEDLNPMEHFFKLREEHAWKTYNNPEEGYVFHIKPWEYMKDCLEHGLRGNPLIEEEPDKKAIFFYTLLEWTEEVAQSFLGNADYGIIRIDKKALEGLEIHWDNVAERAANVSLYCITDRIDPEYLDYIMDHDDYLGGLSGLPGAPEADWSEWEK